MSILKQLDKVLEKDLSEQRDKIKLECDDLRKEMKSEKIAHDKQIDQEKEEFAIYQRKCNQEIEKEKKLLADSIKDLDNIKDGLKALEIQKENVDKANNVFKEKEVALENATTLASQAEDRSKKTEDLYNKKLANL